MCRSCEYTGKKMGGSPLESPDGFIGDYTNFKRRLNPSPSQCLVRNTKKEGNIFQAIIWANITLILKVDKKQRWRQISNMNVDAKIHHKMLASQIQQHTKRIIQIIK